MFGLIRRISNSVVPRPDRPWDDDATSNAPKTSRKRRLSSTEQDLDDDTEAQSRAKKSRGDTPQTPLELPGNNLVPDSEGVKEVTKGVKEVELEEKQKGNDDKTEVASTDDESREETVVDPESVPLPEEVSGELDETSSIASTPPAAADEDEDEEASQLEEKTQESLTVPPSVPAETESHKDESKDSEETPIKSVVESSHEAEAVKKDEA